MKRFIFVFFLIGCQQPKQPNLPTVNKGALSSTSLSGGYIVSPMDFGACGCATFDYVTQVWSGPDDGPAFQRAVDSIAGTLSNPGGTLLIDRDYYIGTQAVYMQPPYGNQRPSLDIVGAGGRLVIDVGTTQNAFSFGNVGTIRFQHVAFVANALQGGTKGPNGEHAFRVINAGYTQALEVNDCFFGGLSTAYGIVDATSMLNFVFINNTVGGGPVTGYNAPNVSGTVHFGNVSRAEIRNNRFTDFGYLGGQNTIPIPTHSWLSFDNPPGFIYGVQGDAGVLIEGNMFDEHGDIAVWSDPGNSTLMWPSVIMRHNGVLITAQGQASFILSNIDKLRMEDNGGSVRGTSPPLLTLSHVNTAIIDGTRKSGVGTLSMTADNTVGRIELIDSAFDIVTSAARKLCYTTDGERVCHID